MLPIPEPVSSLDEVIHSPGYVVWLVSMILLVIAGYLGLLFPRKLDPVQRKLWATERELSTLRSEVRALRERVGFQRGLMGHRWALLEIARRCAIGLFWNCGPVHYMEHLEAPR
jgi:hypothetical protein